MTALEALQATLAAEHAAVHLYGVYGARTSHSGAPALHAALVSGYREHRARRDQLRLLVSDLGAAPVAAAPAYEVPGRLTAPGRIAAAALATEEACAGSCAALVSETVGEQRRWALGALTWSAVHALSLGGAPEAWPGAPELD